MTTAADRRAIGDLIYELAAAIDDGDLDAVERLFGDATFTLAGRPPRVGGVAFRDVIATGMRLYEAPADGAGRPARRVPRTRHVVTNLSVAVDADATTATADSAVLVLQAVPPDFPLQAVMGGRYHDRFARDAAGRWRFVERAMTVDLVGDTSRHSPNRF